MENFLRSLLIPFVETGLCVVLNFLGEGEGGNGKGKNGKNGSIYLVGSSFLGAKKKQQREL